MKVIAALLLSMALVACAMQYDPETPSLLTRQADLYTTTTPVPKATSRWPSSHTPQPSSGASSERVSCTESEYKTEAKKHMQRIGDWTDTVELDTDATVKSAKRDIEAILKDIRNMKCAKAYPLKQETLEYSAIHSIRALDSWLDGDLSGFNDSMDSAILNAGWFNDWSLDMERK